MQELTMQQMSVRGGELSFGRFFDGFLCGVMIVGIISLTPGTVVLARLAIRGGLIAACGNAFFG